MPTRTRAAVPIVAVGGVIGSLARAALDTAIPHVDPLSWPWSTFVVNIIGSLVLGVVLGILLRHSLAWWTRPLLVTGVLGGFTTFSAYAMQTRDLLTGSPVNAVLYAAGSIVAGVIAVALGLALTGGGRRGAGRAFDDVVDQA